jgi:hypothetical protein
MIDWIIYGLLGSVFTGCIVMAVRSRKKEPIAFSLAGLNFTRKEAAFNTLITGKIGSGKTMAAMKIMDDLFKNVPGWSGLFLDFKGDAHIDLMRLAEKHGRADDIVIIEVATDGKRKYPVQRLNLLTALGPDVVAPILADISMRSDSTSKNAGFFKSQCELQIEKAIKYLQHRKIPVTMESVHEFLTVHHKTLELLGTVEINSDGKKVCKPYDDSMVDHWFTGYLNQPPDQYGGVISSITNAMSPFLKAPLAEVFSSELPNTIDFKDIEEKGKILCVLCPHSLPREKACLNQYAKALFLYVGAARFDSIKFGKDPQKERMLVAFMDEYQKSASKSDEEFMDNLRSANCVFIAAMQSPQSVVPVLGKDVAQVVLSKFCNRIVFKAENSDCAEASAGILGKKEKWKYSYSSNGGKSGNSRSQVDEYIIKPGHFLRLKPWHCVIVHGGSSKFKRNAKLPMV